MRLNREMGIDLGVKALHVGIGEHQPTPTVCHHQSIGDRVHRGGEKIAAEFQFPRPALQGPHKLKLAFFKLQLHLAIVGDIGIDGDLPPFGKRRHLNLQHPAVRQSAIEGLNLRPLRFRRDPRHQFIDIAGPVISAQGEVADDIGQVRSRIEQTLRRIEQILRHAAEDDHIEIVIKKRNVLMNRTQQGRNESRVLYILSYEMPRQHRSTDPRIIQLLKPITRRNLNYK
ncbi:hypothetical protein [Breoghania sp.]|uniref:hypothetical protein n=1 Tax=Breoghania sp. TaxID=2065378 RepID=UPI00262DABB6|nr:hypothetical protein [Breoghania sp.]MDJ0929904.1 hypothetical protein [Breoghania sp.]